MPNTFIFFPHMQSGSLVLPGSNKPSIGIKFPPEEPKAAFAVGKKLSRVVGHGSLNRKLFLGRFVLIAPFASERNQTGQPTAEQKRSRRQRNGTQDGSAEKSMMPFWPLVERTSAKKRELLLVTAFSKKVFQDVLKTYGVELLTPIRPVAPPGPTAASITGSGACARPAPQAH